MRIVFGAFLLIFLGVVGVFAVQNTQTIDVRFLNWGMTAPVAILALAVYVLGMLSGWTVVGFVKKSIRSVTETPRS